MLGWAVAPGPAAAVEAKSAAAQLSDRAFALLNFVTSHGDSSNPIIGPVASFAADAQGLDKAVGSGDRAAAGRAMAALQSDRAAVDGALASSKGAFDAAAWSSLKAELDALSHSIAPAAARAAPPLGPAHRPEAAGEGPKVRIESTERDDRDTIHIRGYVEGVGMQAAGIYQGARELRAFEIEQMPERQHINFDVQVQRLVSGMSVRASDRFGRSAEAAVPVLAAITVETPPPSESANTAAAPPSLGRGSRAPEVSPGMSAGVDSSGDDSLEGGHENTAEIPSNNPPARSRRALSGRASGMPGDLRIEISNLTPIDPANRQFEVSGQISGSRIERAGIYVDGKLARQIALSGGPGYATETFDETFEMSGAAATIRVYGAGARYIESSIPLGARVMQGPRYGANPNRLSIQIGAVRPLSPQVYSVSGIISGSNLASAGLYQNGVLVQPLAVSGGLLSSLMPAVLRQVSFSTQFNPGAGLATVRVFDRNGQFVEQPVMVSAGAPYAGNPPYSYSAPGYGPGGGYGVNPYGARPAAPNPYPYSYNPPLPAGNPSPYSANRNPYPYQYPNQPYPNQPPPATNWWQQLLR